MVVLEEPFKTLWAGKDPFEEVEKISGSVYRKVLTRRTLRFSVRGKGYFLKLHHGADIKDTLQDLSRLRTPVLGADREWKAIHKLAEVGVDTMRGVAFGQKGWNPVRRTSFIVTEDLCPAMSLEQYCARWVQNPPDPTVKRLLIRRVAQMTRKMHAAGINHRDCYICHFLMAQGFDGTEGTLKLSLIDLHRSQIRDRVPIHWRNKDLAQLFFSARDIGLTDRDVFRFLREYFQAPLREILDTERGLFHAVLSRARHMVRHTPKHTGA